MDEVKTLQERAAAGREAYGSARNATPDQVRAMMDMVGNDEASSDAELIQHFIREVGVTEAEAKKYVAKRGDAFRGKGDFALPGRNASIPKVGDTVAFPSHGGETLRIHIVDGNYIEVGDVGMSATELERGGAGHWIYRGEVEGGIGKARNRTSGPASNAPMSLQEKAACGREAYGSAKNAERISLMFDSPDVARRAEGLIRSSAHPTLSGSSVVVDYSALGAVHSDLEAEDLMQYLGSETMK